jgi:hypothetical protein
MGSNNEAQTEKQWRCKHRGLVGGFSLLGSLFSSAFSKGLLTLEIFSGKRILLSFDCTGYRTLHTRPVSSSAATIPLYQHFDAPGLK